MTNNEPTYRSPRQTLDEQLDILRQQVLRMGRMVEEMVTKAVRALDQRDPQLGQEACNNDDAVDALDLEIESYCMEIIARQQPMATDLRIIGTAMKVIADLERIGDHAVDIGKVATRLCQRSLPISSDEIVHLAVLAVSMLRDSLTAFIEMDRGRAIAVCQADNEVDQFYNHLFYKIIEIAKSSPSELDSAAHMLFVAKYLERIADHATNIAERVNYIITGNLEQLARSHQSERTEAP